jgi:hypothetical protein
VPAPEALGGLRAQGAPRGGGGGRRRRDRPRSPFHPAPRRAVCARRGARAAAACEQPGLAATVRRARGSECAVWRRESTPQRGPPSLRGGRRPFCFQAAGCSARRLAAGHAQRGQQHHPALHRRDVMRPRSVQAPRMSDGSRLERTFGKDPPSPRWVRPFSNCGAHGGAVGGCAALVVEKDLRVAARGERLVVTDSHVASLPEQFESSPSSSGSIIGSYTPSMKIYQ